MSVNKKGKIKIGYLKSLSEIEELGFRIDSFGSDKVQIVHPCGKHLTIRKRVMQCVGTTIELEFRLEEIRKDREIWKVVTLYDGYSYGYSVYGEMIRDIKEIFLEDDLFTI